MTTNEVLIRHNFVSKIPFKNDLSKDLKVKIMSMRIEYAKVRKSFDEDLQSFIQDGYSEDLKNLQMKENKSHDDELLIEELNKKFNEEYNSYIAERSSKDVSVTEYNLTLDEYNEIILCNFPDQVEINGHNIPTADYLEILYNLFVKE